VSATDQKQHPLFGY